MNILHLTHTDINTDSRILKEMNSLASSELSLSMSGIGVTTNENVVSSKENHTKLNIESIILKSRKLTFLPKVLRHAITLVELTFKMFSRAIKIKPKVIHCHDTLVLPLGVLVKVFSGAKLIYDAHELESNKNGSTKILSKLTLFTEKVLWKYIDALIVVSSSIENWYKENIGTKYSAIILNSPVLEKSSSNPNPEYLREKFKISKESKIFLYIGILGRGRGIELISEVFKKHKLKSSLVFLGYGELSDELKELSKEHKNIYVHDAVSHEKVVSVAQSADIGLCLIENVSLSDYYCLPNKLFEYSFAQIPILASDFPDISKVINQYQIGKLTNLDEDSIYKAIIEIEKSEELPIVNSEELYALSWGAQENKLIKLYDTLIEGK